MWKVNIKKAHMPRKMKALRHLFKVTIKRACSLKRTHKNDRKRGDSNGKYNRLIPHPKPNHRKNYPCDGRHTHKDGNDGTAHHGSGGEKSCQKSKRCSKHKSNAKTDGRAIKRRLYLCNNRFILKHQV